MPFNIVRILALVLLIGAFGKHSYSYFIWLRIAVTICGVIGSARSFQQRQEGFGAAWLLIAILFNPLVKISFARDGWLVVDGLTAIFIAASFFLEKRRKDSA